MAKERTKFQSHPRLVEGEIEGRKYNAGWTVFEIPSTLCVIVFQFIRSQIETQKS